MSYNYNTNKRAILSRFMKQAAQPPMDPSMGGGAPPMDPSMGGGAPPMDPSMMGGGMPPMDPSMMGGGGGMPPMDPSMMGGGMPPMDPSMMGMMPMSPAAPAATDPTQTPEAKVSNKIKTEQWMSHIDSYCYNMLNLIIEMYNQLGLKIPSQSLLPKPLDQDSNSPSAEELSKMLSDGMSAPPADAALAAMGNPAGAAPVGPDMMGGMPPMDSGMGDGAPPMESAPEPAKTASYRGFVEDDYPLSLITLMHRLGNTDY